MKRFLVIFAVLSLTAGAAFGPDFDYANEIGIYTTTAPTAADRMFTSTPRRFRRSS